MQKFLHIRLHKQSIKLRMYELYKSLALKNKKVFLKQHEIESVGTRTDRVFY
ncbi:hypothetical protein LEP1GSC074_3826 [Leptospira noguchii str. Hook]|nr:hypothetical protein LEP1GSC074_3826 [Leptospira noguchii str. Hook]